MVATIPMATTSMLQSCKDEEEHETENKMEHNDTEISDSLKGKCITVGIAGISNGLVSSWAIGMEKDWHIRFNASDLNELSLSVGDTIDVKIIEYEYDFLQYGYRGPYITCQKVTSCQ